MNATAYSQTGCSGSAPAPELHPCGAPAAATSPYRAFVNKPHLSRLLPDLPFLLNLTHTTKSKRQAAARAAWREVPTIIGHLADYDEDGGDIADAFAEDALAFTEWHHDYEDAPGSLSIVRLGLTREQAQAHDLLDADDKAEIDGLPVPVLDGIVRDWIESHLDPIIARSVVEAEPEMRAEVARLTQRLVKRQPSSRQPDTSSDWSWTSEP